MCIFTYFSFGNLAKGNAYEKLKWNRRSIGSPLFLGGFLRMQLIQQKITYFTRLSTVKI